METKTRNLLCLGGLLVYLWMERERAAQLARLMKSPDLTLDDLADYRVVILDDGTRKVMVVQE